MKTEKNHPLITALWWVLVFVICSMIFGYVVIESVEIFKEWEEVGVMVFLLPENRLMGWILFATHIGIVYCLARGAMWLAAKLRGKPRNR